MPRRGKVRTDSLLSQLSATVVKSFMNVEYMVGRAAGVLVKPLSLIVTNYLFGNFLASELAAAFLAVMVLNGLLGFDLHRDFYSAYFSLKKSSMLAHRYQDYLSSLIAVSFLGALIIIFFFSLKGKLVVLSAIAIGVYFFSERMIDESLRFELYAERFESWGRFATVRGLFQGLAFGTASFILVQVEFEPIAALVGSMALGNFAVFFVLKSGVSSRRAAIKRLSSVRRWPEAVGRMVDVNKIYWLISALGILLSISDRLVVSLVAFEKLAYFSLLASCFSIMVMSLDYLVFSMARGKLLRGDITSREIIMSSKCLIVLFFSSVCGGVAAAALPAVYPGVAVDYWLVVFVFMLQLCVAITVIPREFVYWHCAPVVLVAIELGAVLMGVILVWLSSISPWPIRGALLGLFLVLIFRFFVLEWLSGRAAASSRLAVQ